MQRLRPPSQAAHPVWISSRPVGWCCPSRRADEEVMALLRQRRAHLFEEATPCLPCVAHRLAVVVPCLQTVDCNPIRSNVTSTNPVPPESPRMLPSL